MDESSEDVGTVQIPSNWRSTIEDEATLSTILQAYSSSQPPQSAQAMECVAQLASVRRSLFPNQEVRQVFLTKLLTGVAAILRSQQGLQEEENFHEFCRLLSRIKSNFQLSEMVKSEVYPDLLSLVADFTINSFQSCPFASNSVYYLLQLWSRMVTSVAYLKGDGESHLDRCISRPLGTHTCAHASSGPQSHQYATLNPKPQTPNPKPCLNPKP